MSYSSWFQTHGEKHKAIMDRLIKLSDEEVIDYFRFENMVEKEPEFCPLYKENKKCHNIEELNCYLCACPNFRFDDKGFKQVEEKTLYSTCNIDSKDGSHTSVMMPYTKTVQGVMYHIISHIYKKYLIEIGLK